MMTKLRSLVLLGGILLLVFAAVPGMAQTATTTPVAPQANEFEITGTVTALTTATITVNGITIGISGAEIHDPIAVGALMKVHYSVSTNGVRVAREVELAVGRARGNQAGGNQTGNTSEFEITGIVSALTSTTVTIDNQVIQTTGAEFNDPITVGALVKVHYSVGANGTLVARELELAFNQGLDDNSDDDNGHDLNDDHGNDGINHDLNDDHGGDSSGNSGDDDQSGDSSGHGGDDDHGDDDSSGNSGDDDHGDDSSGHSGDDDHGGDNSGHGGDDD